MTTYCADFITVNCLKWAASEFLWILKKIVPTLYCILYWLQTSISNQYIKYWHMQKTIWILILPVVDFGLLDLLKRYTQCIPCQVFVVSSSAIQHRLVFPLSTMDHKSQILQNISKLVDSCNSLFRRLK